MKKLGIIAAATYAATYRGENADAYPGSHHGTAFSTTFNGYDEQKADQWDWTFIKADNRIEDARITKVWDPQREWAERLAETCYIDEVVDTPEAGCEDVDAVLIVDDGSGEHHKFAGYPLEHGVPTYCDKPLAMTAKAADQMAQLVRRTGTPFMSASSLRFVPDIVALRDSVAELGDVHLVTTICGNELIYYGIHALSLYYGVFGGGAVSCLNVGKPDCNIVRVRFEHDRDLVLMVGESDKMRAGYQINIFGTQGWKSLVPDTANLYYYLLQRFMHLLDTGEEPVPVEEEVEGIAVLEAGKRSLLEGREVTIAEMLE